MSKSFLLAAPLILMVFFVAMGIAQSNPTLLYEPLTVTHDVINPVGTNKTLYVEGYSTAKTDTPREPDLRVGHSDAGYIRLGSDVDIAHFADDAGNINNLNVNSMFYLSAREPDSPTNPSNISMMFTDNRRPLLAIPFTHSGFGTFSVNSLMVGGKVDGFNENLYKCSNQGFKKIDCDNDLTGQDLAVQDDAQIKGTIYVGETVNFYDSTTQSGIQMRDENLNKVCMRCWSNGICNATAGNC